ncbi:MAG: murein biosynthesis integral membrane protein MurJ [Chloroflexi bacterium]|nr:murein biosynthesis integral membrane protein MurJ [Chloroflexota bacterium]
MTLQTSPAAELTAATQTNVHPHRIARAAAVVMAFFVASRLLGLVRDVVISHQFGTTRALDAYFAAFSIPDLLFNVIAGGALGSAFIPVFAAALAQGDNTRAWKLASAVLNWALILLTGLAALMALFAPQVVAATVGRGFAPADQALTGDLMRWMLITPIVFGLSGIVMGILNAHQHFVLPAAAPVAYNAAIIGGAVLLAPTMGVYGLAAGVVAGACLHLLIQVPWLIRQHMHYSLTLGVHSVDVRQVGRLMLPRTLGLAAVQINFLVNTILASGLPAGRIAALQYAWRVMLLPEGIVALSLATAVFPTFSQQTAREELEDFRRTFSGVFRATLYLTIPAAVGLIILGGPLIALLFQRGEFDSQSTAETAWALQFYALGLCAHSGLEIITRAFYAMHDTRTPVAIGVAAIVLNVVLSLVLVGPLAQGGLALANSVATLLEMSVLFFLLEARLKGIANRTLGLSLARTASGALLMGAILWPFVGHFSNWGPAALATLGALIGGTIYLAATAGLRAEEIGFVVRRLRR